jgi:hypothetical protein
MTDSMTDSMTTRTRTRTRRVSVPAYYLGRPAALWLAALAPRSTTHKSPRATCASKSALPGEDGFSRGRYRHRVSV